MRKLIGLAALTVVLAGCGGGSGDSAAQVTKWCADVAQYPTVLAAVASVNGHGNYDDMQRALGQSNALLQSLKDDAPPSIKTDVATVIDTKSDSTKASEQDAAAKARPKVNAYIRAKCDSTVEL